MSKGRINDFYTQFEELTARFEKQANEILYFPKHLKVPSSNNPAEISQRGVKVKQKIEKFRSINGADSYSIIKSCMLTYKKNNINVFNSAFNGNGLYEKK